MLTSAWFQACAAVNAFHYNEVFYFLQLSLYVILKGTGIRLVYVLLQPLSQWQCFAISHFYGHTFKCFFVTLSLGFKDNELIFRSNDSKVSFLCTLHITAGDSVSLLFCALKESHACANHIQRQKRKKNQGSPADLIACLETCFHFSSQSYKMRHLSEAISVFMAMSVQKPWNIIKRPLQSVSLCSYVVIDFQYHKSQHIREKHNTVFLYTKRTSLPPVVIQAMLY